METWKAFLRRGPDAEFWPATADVDGFLRPIADQHRARLATLRRIAADGSLPSRLEPSPPELVSEAACMTLAEPDAAIAAIRAKHGVPRSSAGNDEEEVGRVPPSVRPIPVVPVVLQAIRDRASCRIGPRTSTHHKAR